ncbi:hypothetical protein BJY52DRAFT_453131 [Lactarius psammicola]|nr:hypothetical protein BJY52DRAFT_453131 [Lactarius psammicola]
MVAERRVSLSLLCLLAAGGCNNNRSLQKASVRWRVRRLRKEHRIIQCHQKGAHGWRPQSEYRERIAKGAAVREGSWTDNRRGACARLGRTYHVRTAFTALALLSQTEAHLYSVVTHRICVTDSRKRILTDNENRMLIQIREILHEYKYVELAAFVPFLRAGFSG